MFEFTVPVGAKVPIPHYNEHFDETIYGLAGAGGPPDLKKLKFVMAKHGLIPAIPNM